MARILTMCNFAVGGAETAALAFSQELLRRGHDVGVFNSHPSQSVSGAFLGLLHRVQQSSETSHRTLRFIQDKRFAVTFGADIIWSHGYWADAATLSVRECLGGVPWIQHLHGCYDNPQNWTSVPNFGSTAARALGSSSGILAGSRKNRNAVDAYSVGQPFKVVPNPILARAHTASADSLFISKYQGRNCSERDMLRLGLISRAVAGKGWDDLFELAKEFAQSSLADVVRIELIGDGPVRSWIESRIDGTPRVKDTLSMPGEVPNPDFASLDIGIIWSRFKSESRPLVLGEYFAAGLPVIVLASEWLEALLHDGGLDELTFPGWIVEDGPDARVALSRLVASLTQNRKLIAERAALIPGLRSLFDSDHAVEFALSFLPNR